MTFLRFFAACAALALLPWSALAQGTSAVKTDYVRAELLAHAPDGVQPGKPLWVGLQITHQPEWHTYWKNSGDSGLPTELTWTLPAGLVAGDIAWPVPKKIPIGNLANYGYEDTVLLPVPLTVTQDFKPSPLSGDLEIRLRANWLVCKKECIPEQGEFRLKLPVRGTTALHAQAFEGAFARQPKPVMSQETGIVPASTARIEDGALAVTVQGLPVALRGKVLEFFPETGEVIDNGAKWTQAWNGAAWTARVPLSAQRSASPEVMPVVLASGGEGWRTELRVLGTWPQAAAAPATVSPALEQALRENAASPALPSSTSLGLAAALLGALVGGLILNLMPCVFPVLAIKVVGFTRHADDRRGHRIGGLAYTAGVVLSFAALGGLMLALRAAGEQLGWGFQLQSPAVVASLAALFTLIALNFAGVFEFRSLLPSSVATLEARHPVLNSFLTGVLAVAVASPCTAPFMGASLGLAISLPAWEALAIFIVLGLGMALPYLLASWVPGVAQRLPRPGAWMETFRRLMAFPMFATVAWLVWVLGQQSGIDGAGALLALLVALSMVVWALTLRGRTRVAIAGVALAGFAALAWTAGGAITRSVAAQPLAAAEGRWQAWAPGRVDQLLAAGQPVFVDFTAAWCVTCQYNKKTTLADREVLADFDAGRYALLRADWTRRDPAITAALAQLGRNGVPVYVVYRPGRPPVVLSEILGVQEVRAALSSPL
ncbi:MAG: protein-disulfide reductase [Comamonadaceae bacterium]|nr:MAG: protein-disulfide reductase [Comamonadaceae bacterium]